MSALDRLRAIRSTLGAGVVVRAIGWGTAVALSLLIGAAAVDMVVPLDVTLRRAIADLAVVAALTTVSALIWRDRFVFSLPRVALWVEERVPSLEYALVTAIESSDDRLIASAEPSTWVPMARSRAVNAVFAPLVALVASAVVLLLLPAGAVARVRSPRPGDALDRAVGAHDARVNRLSPIVADVIPPAYSGQKPSTVDEPRDVRALVGSRLIVRGRGSGDGIAAKNGVDSVVATSASGRWAIDLRVGDKPAVVRIHDGPNQRLIAVEPVIDAPPVVTLTAPAHDSVLREPKGRVPLAADLADDIGLANGAFELIVSSGEGETFTFKSGTLAARALTGRTASLVATLNLDSLGLKPGDIVHVRAVARDGNTVTGPGLGTSETRAIRIARADEYDSVAVDAAAPGEADKSVISERMLIMLAEELQKNRPRLSRDTLLRESHAIAVDQKRLRRSVGDVVFTRLGGTAAAEESTDEENPRRAKSIQDLLAKADSATNRSVDPIDFAGDESPVVAVNKPLLEAYNAMWDAALGLEMGEPDRALPHMRRALDAIQRVRKAERLYLRGAPPRVVIDLDKARLKGKDKGASSTRRSLTAADSVAAARADRFARVLETWSRDPRSALDSLLVLRVDALTDQPAFAAALGDAVAAIRGGRADQATTALARARRALGGAPVARDSLSRWGLVP